MTERRSNLASRDRFEGLRNDLECRLSTVSPHLQQPELAELTAKMVRLQIKYDQLTSVPRKDDCRSVRTRGAQGQTS
jgi:hypothetical protein